ncbi:MAG: hypothetical protein IPO80_06730 [Propionibacteriaceae bacterium]|nr:hypothetical protein [Propionibacteriaceae bacterium]
MSALIVMIVILAIALAVIAIVAVGMQGNLADRAPEIAHVMANTARHLNGDAQPPRGLVEFFDEIPVPKSADSATEAARR